MGRVSRVLPPIPRKEHDLSGETEEMGGVSYWRPRREASCLGVGSWRGGHTGASDTASLKWVEEKGQLGGLAQWRCYLEGRWQVSSHPPGFPRH